MPKMTGAQTQIINQRIRTQIRSSQTFNQQLKTLQNLLKKYQKPAQTNIPKSRAYSKDQKDVILYFILWKACIKGNFQRINRYFRDLVYFYFKMTGNYRKRQNLKIKHYRMSQNGLYDNILRILDSGSLQQKLRQTINILSSNESNNIQESQMQIQVSNNSNQSIGNEFQERLENSNSNLHMAGSSQTQSSNQHNSKTIFGETHHSSDQKQDIFNVLNLSDQFN